MSEVEEGPKKGKTKKEVDITNIQLKEEHKHRTGKLHSVHLDRPVLIEAVAANPQLYLKKYARKYVSNKGQGVYPLLSLFDLTEDQIEALAKL